MQKPKIKDPDVKPTIPDIGPDEDGDNIEVGDPNAPETMEEDVDLDDGTAEM